MTKTRSAKGNYEVCYDDTAGVWEAYRVERGQWIWIGAFDTVQEANEATHKDEWR
jgi:hypothetical protein